MVVPFLLALRARNVPVGMQEALSLARALSMGLHEDSLDGFYYVARAVCVHDEAQLDAFDEAFLAHFRGVASASRALRDELLRWLEHARQSFPSLTEEERKLFAELDGAELEAQFEQRLSEQKERHDGGPKWIGTGGKSPFGHHGAPRPGIRVAGEGLHRSALRVASERQFRAYRTDVTLDVRQLGVALRKLRMFVREGALSELDLEGTIAATARNAGELEVELRAARRPDTRVILMMDVGGSMDPFAELVSRLFSAAKQATQFKELRYYYFHNAIYGAVYRDAQLRDRVAVHDLLRECGPHYKLICIGDALMAPYELLSPNGSPWLDGDAREPAIQWLMRLQAHFPRSCWLNPEPAASWTGNTIEHVRSVFPMFELSLDGLAQAVLHLTSGTRGR